MAARQQPGLSADQAGQLRLLRESSASSPEPGGATWADFQQTISNVPVFEGLVKVTMSAGGESASVTLPAWLPSRLNTVLAGIAPKDAVRAAMRLARVNGPASEEDLETIPAANAEIAFRNPLGAGNDPILVDLVAFPVSAESARLAWQIHFDGGPGRRAEMVIDAVNGQTLFCHSIERRAGTGRVWRVAPDKGPRDLVPFPDGWLPAGRVETTGNNVDAYLDANGDNFPDALAETGVRQGHGYAENQVFDFAAPDPLTNTDDPRKFRAASIVSAFYFANTARDYFYGLGFDEAAGNFQRDNGGRPGLGGDPVRVEVQDRFSTNNASMTPARDGTSPRLELGIMTRGTSSNLGDDRDLAYSGQTIFHEYAHGVTTRSVGGGTSTSCLSGTQSRALDEGWADYFSSSFFNDPIQGAFFFGNGSNGIRRFSYEGYPLNYEDLGRDGFQEHDDGEIWAGTLWDIRKALGQQVTDKLVYTALRQTPCRPTFISARDAILAADETLNRSANRARLWTLFARHGLGASAGAVDGIAGVGAVYDSSFDLPADLQPGNRNPAIGGPPPVLARGGEPFSYQIQAADPDGNPLRYELASGPAGMTVDQTGLVRWAPQFRGARVKIVITDGQGGRLIHGFYLQVVTTVRPGLTNSISIPVVDETVFLSFDVPPNTPVLQLTGRGGNGDVDFSLFGPRGEVEFEFLPRSGAFETMSVGNPSPGLWIATLYAYLPFENAQVTASLPVPRLLKGSETVLNLSGDASSETFYRVAVPQGATALALTTAGGTGDIDLFAARETPPVCQSFPLELSFRCFFQRSSARFGNNETIQINAPQSGNWYINLSASANYSGVSLTTALAVPPTLVVDPATANFNVLEGATAPVTRVIRISDPSGSRFDWTAVVGPAAAWLKLSADKGSGDADVTLTVTATGLTQGTYRTSITITGAGLGSSPLTIPVVLTIVRPPVIAASVATLNFTAPAGSSPPSQTLDISNTGGGTLEWSVTPTTASGGNWLSVDRPRGSGNARLVVAVRAGTLAPGTYDGALTIGATGAAATLTVRVRYIVTVAVTLIDERLRSLSSARPGYALSPGDLVEAEGTNFTRSCSIAVGAGNPCAPSGYPLPTESGGLRMLVNGIPAPLVFVSPELVRFIVPFEVTGTELRIVASQGPGAETAPVLRALERQSIGVFTVLGLGAGAGRIYHADETLVSATAPLTAGERVTIQGSGLGAVDQPLASGAAAPAEPLAMVAMPVQVYMDGTEATVEAAYLQPGLAGVYRIRVVVPEGLPRRFPVVQVQSAVSQSQEVSAGGPSLGNLAPATVPRGADAVVILNGINLPASPVVRIGEESLTAEVAATPGSETQTVRVTIPAALLPAQPGGELALTVADAAAPGEAASNVLILRTR